MNPEANHFGQLGILEYLVNYWRKQCRDCYNAATSYITPKRWFLVLIMIVRKKKWQIGSMKETNFELTQGI